MHDAPHTLSIFDEDLDQLRATVSEMGGRVEAAIHDSVAALVRGDEDLARGVVAGDRRIDALASDVERHGLHMIALRMPLAGDLRDVLAALKIAMLIGRMGDCAKNIAHRSLDVGACRSIEPVRLIQAMEIEVSAMVKAALDAFVRRSASAAVEVRGRDAAIDDYYACIWSALIDHMRDRPDQIEGAAQLLFVTQKLERIGDHATAVAGFVHFAVTAENMPPEEPAQGLPLRAAV